MRGNTVTGYDIIFYWSVMWDNKTWGDSHEFWIDLNGLQQNLKNDSRNVTDCSMQFKGESNGFQPKACQYFDCLNYAPGRPAMCAHVDGHPFPYGNEDDMSS